MEAARVHLRNVLLEARAWLALPNNDFAWSSWEGPESALPELNGLIAALEARQVPPRSGLTVLFAPTGSIQEVSLCSGWADEFLALSARFDAAEAAFYARVRWWQRVKNWRRGG